MQVRHLFTLLVLNLSFFVKEREEDRRRIEELQGENLTLCLAQRRSMDESQLLGWELEQLSKTTKSSQGKRRCCCLSPKSPPLQF